MHYNDLHFRECGCEEVASIHLPFSMGSIPQRNVSTKVLPAKQYNGFILIAQLIDLSTVK